eukprot:Rhum_TRINITY_DN13596_c1_g1::Rhum_TRINITY_DN13596_c1_g1_i2::g.61605::m.61605
MHRDLKKRQQQNSKKNTNTNALCVSLSHTPTTNTSSLSPPPPTFVCHFVLASVFSLTHSPLVPLAEFSLLPQTKKRRAKREHACARPPHPSTLTHPFFCSCIFCPLFFLTHLNATSSLTSFCSTITKKACCLQELCTTRSNPPEDPKAKVRFDSDNGGESLCTLSAASSVSGAAAGARRLRLCAGVPRERPCVLGGGRLRASLRMRLPMPARQTAQPAPEPAFTFGTVDGGGDAGAGFSARSGRWVVAAAALPDVDADYVLSFAVASVGRGGVRVLRSGHAACPEAGGPGRRVQGRRLRNGRAQRYPQFRGNVSPGRAADPRPSRLANNTSTSTTAVTSLSLCFFIVQSALELSSRSSFPTPIPWI